MSDREFYQNTFSKLHTSADFHVEAKTMKMKKPVRSFVVAAVAAALVLCTAVAGMRLLLPREVAQVTGNELLAAAFDAPDALKINESQRCGDYVVDLLGVTSGTALSDFAAEDEIDMARSYVVAAVQRADGEALEQAGETGLRFSPLISGYEPHRVNAWTLYGGQQSFIRDGVEYFIFECSTLEMFADHTVYFAAYEGFVPGSDIFTMAEDGTISFAEGYEGAQALFTLPLDSSKADSAAVAELLQEIGL